MAEWSFAPRVPAGDRAAPARPSRGVQVGERVGGFELLAELGRGGRGVVFQARELASGREVALKLLQGELTPAALERFRREGQAIAALRHPGIVALHATGDAGGAPYLACELVAGGRTLREASEGQPPATVAGLVAQAARALGQAHAQGVVHRDVKPENLLVDPEGRVKVADFGLARLAEVSDLTRSGELLGTPGYMAPEQFSRDPVGPATDVWALGVVLYELTTGALPFTGPTLARLVHQLRSARPAPPRELAPDLPPALEAVILRALARDPAARYPSGQALADALA